MDFIIISTADWDNPFWTNKQHTAKALANLGHRVIYIDSLGLRKPTATIIDTKRIINKIKKIKGGIRKVDNNIWVISPISIPFQGIKLIRLLNEFCLISLIKKYIKLLNFSNPILWTYNPLTSFLIGKIGESKSVYHCVDEMSAQPGMPKDTIIELEKNLLKKVDIVYVTSKTLYENKKKYNDKIYYFSNVADFNHFNKAYTQKWDKPIDIIDNQRKKIGFIGAITNYKVDFNLLDYIAKTHSDCDFYLIGKIGEGEPTTTIDEIKENKNIIFLGAKDYKVLPQYLSFFDVCILPCNKNEYTDSMFPMKFFEYLSAGKPIITTELLSILEFKDYCYVAKNKEEFSKMIDKAINENSEEKIQERFLLAQKYTYESRTKKMLDILNDLSHKRDFK